MKRINDIILGISMWCIPSVKHEVLNLRREIDSLESELMRTKDSLGSLQRQHKSYLKRNRNKNKIIRDLKQKLNLKNCE